jgi:foldase protein PrsA
MKNVNILRATIGLLLIILLAETALFGYREVIYRTSPGNANSNNRNDANKLVAQIGNRQIYSSELTDNLYASHGAELLNQMLDRDAIQMEADELGLKLTRSDIDDELKRMQQGYESEEQFYKSMQDQVGMSKAELREDVNYKLLLEQIATKGINVTDAEIEAYIKLHPDEFKNTVQLYIQQIEVNTLEEATHVIGLLQAGNDFAKVARDQSIDSATAADGGDLGWVEETDPFVTPEVLQAASQLGIGEISKPIPVNSHFFVIRVKDRKTNNKGTQEQIYAALRKQLALQKAPSLKEVTQTLRKKRNAVILDPQFK